MFKVCIDTGGTFSESIVLDDLGELHEFKTATTPRDFSKGVLKTLKEASTHYKITLKEFLKQTEWIIHGTTVSTNALVQRKLSRTALITTAGFRDIIEMRRSLKIETKSMYDAFIPPYEPIVPRYLRFGVEEKTNSRGEIIKPVAEAALKQVIEKIKQEKVEAVAICFINSYANPENEIKAADICKKYLDGVYVTYSSDILPKMGEYERESTCVISASVGPIVSKYLNGLQEKLKTSGFRGQLLMVQANQYVQSVPAIVRKPVYLTGSGPAAGPAGAVHLGKLIGERNFLTGDMGGTTWDAAVVKNGQVSLKNGDWLGDDRLGIKVADVVSIGAGGGSIGWLNPLGLLQVGPQSASAEPGPACYGKGGTLPTVTDAAVVLGYLNPDNFCGGKIKLNVHLARTALETLARPLQMTLEEAAQAMFFTVNSNMADCIAEISTRKGYDVRDFSLLAVGGGGPLCGVFIADILGMPRTVVPRFGASFCAWSMFFLNIGRDYLRSYLHKVDEADPREINRLYEDMVREAALDFKGFNVGKEELIIEKSVDARYQGQYHMLEIKLKSTEISRTNMSRMITEFHQIHKELFTFSLPGIPVEVTNLHLTAKIKPPSIQVKKIAEGTASPEPALIGRRKCYFNKRMSDTPIYNGLKLKAGNVISGNAIIEEPTTTTVIPSGYVCTVDRYGNYNIVRQTGNEGK
jgi:N-methylhydantoinase A